MILGYQAQTNNPIYILKSELINSAGPLINDGRDRPKEN